MNEINNSCIDNYIKNILKKEEYGSSDLQNVTELVVDGNECYDYIDDVKKLSNLEDLELRDLYITDSEIKEISNLTNLKRLACINCTFDNPSNLETIKVISLSLTNCEIEDYTFIYNMTHLNRLTIIRGIIDFYKINNLSNLEYLRVSNSIIISSNNIKIPTIKELFIDNTNITELNFLYNLPNISLLSISSHQELNNQEILNIVKKQADIIYDSIIPNRGEL